MKSIDKLREWSCHTDLHEIADEIEAEIADNYIPLPVDADGVPICVGDVVAAQDEQPFEVRAFQLDALGWFAIERLGSQWNVNQLYHVKPRTLEDVLEDYVVEYQTRHARSEFGAEHFDHVDVHEMVKRYADEIRELLGGDAE